MNLKRLLWGKRTRDVKLEASNEEKLTKKDGIMILDEDRERCERICQNVQKALSMMNAEIPLYKISDSFEMMELGIVEQPTIMVKGRILSKGRVLSTTDLIYLLHNYV